MHNMMQSVSPNNFDSKIWGNIINIQKLNTNIVLLLGSEYLRIKNFGRNDISVFLKKTVTFINERHIIHIKIYLIQPLTSSDVVSKVTTTMCCQKSRIERNREIEK